MAGVMYDDKVVKLPRPSKPMPDIRRKPPAITNK